ncbi:MULTISPECIES: 4-hydroxythreonine-4-phosphate dehydrogenase PdxA [unclassified Endozoicomonas]|uniref:4-hydroxythreonine-4-phosphate dehydrogenase PdxA n=2 Tax=Endozoicomonas TaxID=305899 RepID=UPI0021489661|nr:MULTISPECIES: 4-hydroxythreonine-4-phosphate dehydrogenase PdxA [unclassified Endozoicomonas]
MKPLISMPMGDPAGIGPEVLIKALSANDFSDASRLLVVGYVEILQQTISSCNLPLTIKSVKTCADIDPRTGILNVLEPPNPRQIFELGKVSAAAGKMAYDCIQLATQLALDKEAHALVTPPINKMSLDAANIRETGHTEILADLTDSKHPLTLFEVAGLKVFFLSRHLSLRLACDFVTQKNLIQCAESAVDALKSLGIEAPHLAIAGLNPHCGDNGLFGHEEQEEIWPAVRKLQQLGFNVSGPLPADSVFYQALNGQFDAVISLYHDQGHIATKMVDFHKTISITCGLPFLRTSVDHGTAYDIAGKGVASAVSMTEAIKVAIRYLRMMGTLAL